MNCRRDTPLASVRYAAEFIGPPLGLYATRGAHGQDALHILRRQQCPPPGENSLPRLFHVALPRPELGKEAAPMNWVLNPAARAYLLEVAPMIPFNLEQPNQSWRGRARR
jgi:hypothetical protein